MRANNKIVIVSSTDSFLTRGLTDKMSATQVGTTVLRPEITQMADLDETTRAMVLFLDSNIVDDYSTMVYIRDLSLEKEIPLFLLGRPDELIAAKKVLPDHKIKESFMRPVDINKVVVSINNYLLREQLEDRKTILAVDDSGTMLRNIKGMFEDKYQVMLANSAAMAIKSITLKKPDLILLDYEMPIVDGKQVFEMLKSETDFAAIPVMFLTSVDDVATVSQLTMLRPAGYLLKSMPARDIRRNVDDFFSRMKGHMV